MGIPCGDGGMPCWVEMGIGAGILCATGEERACGGAGGPIGTDGEPADTPLEGSGGGGGSP